MLVLSVPVRSPNWDEETGQLTDIAIVWIAWRVSQFIVPEICAWLLVSQ